MAILQTGKTRGESVTEKWRKLDACTLDMQVGTKVCTPQIALYLTNVCIFLGLLTHFERIIHNHLLLLVLFYVFLYI